MKTPISLCLASLFLSLCLASLFLTSCGALNPDIFKYGDDVLTNNQFELMIDKDAFQPGSTVKVNVEIDTALPAGK